MCTACKLWCAPCSKCAPIDICAEHRVHTDQDMVALRVPQAAAVDLQPHIWQQVKSQPSLDFQRGLVKNNKKRRKGKNAIQWTVWQDLAMGNKLSLNMRQPEVTVLLCIKTEATNKHLMNCCYMTFKWVLFTELSRWQGGLSCPLQSLWTLPSSTAMPFPTTG